MSSTKTKESLFDRLWDMTEKEQKELEKPFVENRLRRGFAAAYDEVQLQIMDYKNQINNLYTGGAIQSLDLNRVISLRSSIADAEATAEIIDSEYQELFNESLSSK